MVVATIAMTEEVVVVAMAAVEEVVVAVEVDTMIVEDTVVAVEAAVMEVRRASINSKLYQHYLYEIKHYIVRLKEIVIRDESIEFLFGLLVLITLFNHTIVIIITKEYGTLKSRLNSFCMTS